jgi:RNA-directed DNA polymerase
VAAGGRLRRVDGAGLQRVGAHLPVRAAGASEQRQALGQGRYFAAFHPSRKDRWVFGARDSGHYLVKFSWTPIVRHRLVKGRASIDDPNLGEYWARRRRRDQPPLGTFLLRLLGKQQGRCSGCGGLLLDADHTPQHPDEWEQWFKVVRKAIRRTAVTTHDGPTDDTERHLIHIHCARRLASLRAGPAQHRSDRSGGLA